MFENIALFRNPYSSKPLDAGLLAETLLYFSEVTLVLDYSSARALIEQIGVNLFFEVIDQKLVKAVYMTDFPVTHSESRVVGQNHKFVYMSFAGRGPTSGHMSHIGTNLRGMLEMAGVPKNQLGRKVSEFRDRIPINSIANFDATGEAAQRLAIEDINDHRMASSAINRVLSLYAPKYVAQNPAYLRAFSKGDEFVLDTDIDFVTLNRAVKEGSKENGAYPAVEFTPAYLAGCFFSARVDSMLARQFKTGLTVSEYSRRITEAQFARTFSQIDHSLSAKDLFQETVLPEVPNIRSAVNSGSKSFPEFLDFLPKAERFKKWIGELDGDQALTTEYIREVTSENWLDGLPGKSARFSIFTGGGILLDIMGTGGLGTLAGLGLSTVDNFLLDDLAQGWKPNMFIDELKEFSASE